MNIEQTVLRSPRTPSHNHSHNIIGFVWLLDGGLGVKIELQVVGYTYTLASNLEANPAARSTNQGKHKHFG